MCEFNPFNQILLSLSDVSSAFHDSIWIIYTVWHIFVSVLTQMLHKIRLKCQINLIKFGKKD